MIRIIGHLGSGSTTCGTLIGGSGVGGISAKEEQREEIVSIFIRIIGNSHELHRYAAERLYRTVVLADAEGENGRIVVTEPLLQSTIWAIGEFADIIVGTGLATDDQLVTILQDWTLPSKDFSPLLVGYAISALGKLTHRFNSKRLTSQVQQALAEIAVNHVDDYQLHYRAIEMGRIVGNSTLRSLLLGRSQPEIDGDRLGQLSDNTVKSPKFASGSRLRSAGTLSDGGRTSTPLGTPQSSPTADAVFAELATMSLDYKNGPPAAYQDGDLAVYFHPLRSGHEDELSLRVKVEVRNARAGGRLEDFIFQAAVPKSMKLQMQPAAGTTIAIGDSIEQILTITKNDRNNRAKLRCRLSYRLGESADVKEVQFDYSNFE
jgi:AP-1 complex subunit gamma-1